MNNKLYVGGLNFAATQQDLSDFFIGSGTVLEAIVVTDRGTGNSRGFGFVTMSSEAEALNAIEKLNGKELLGREVSIKLALEREARPQGNFDNRGGDRGGFRGNRGRSGDSRGPRGGESGGNRDGGHRGS
ncbi:MAG: RNA-binding protein [Verrucomicrobia bacterium]|nr:RNA-binding protein [Verrucomicrobiota bacterium]